MTPFPAPLLLVTAHQAFLLWSLVALVPPALLAIAAILIVGTLPRKAGRGAVVYVPMTVIAISALWVLLSGRLLATIL